MPIEIYLEEEAPEYLARSAKDLAEYLGRSISTQVYAKPLPGSDAEPGIWVGRTPASDKLKDRMEELGPDGYLLWGDGNQLVICGKTHYGTANGIYSFLQRFLGIRWFMPGRLFEFVPRHEGFKLPVVEEISEPSFSFRMFSGLQGEEGSDWSRRNLLSRARPELIYGALGHNLFRVFPPEEFGRHHPEIYSLIHGQRITDQSSHRGQPCFSNPSVAEIAISKLREHFDANPDSSAFSLSVNDNMDFCQCDDCASFGVRRFRGRPIYSNAYFHFVNRVAREILETHPDKFIGALAYWGVELPPQQIKALPSNVIIFLTQDTSQHHDSQYREEDRGILQEWTRKCNHLVKYDYYGLGWLAPRYFPGLSSEDLVFLRDSGGIGFYSEAYPFWPNIAPQIYMAAQLMWNVRRDPRELLDEFFAFLSPVTEEVAGFYEVLEKSWLRRRPGGWFEGFEDLPEELKVMTLEEANDAWALITKAHQESTGNCRKRVEFLRDGFELSYRLIRGYRIGSQLRFLPVAGDGDVEAGLALLNELWECHARIECVHREAIAPSDHYHTIYFKDDRFARKLLAWEGMAKASCLVWLETAYRYLIGEPARWNNLIKRLPRTLTRPAASIARSAELNELLVECGLETAMPAEAGSEGYGMMRWQISGGEERECTVDPSFSHSGNRSLRFESRGWSRLSIYLPVKPGSEYLVGAWCYADLLSRKKSPKMDLTFCSGQGPHPGRIASSDVVQASGEWQRLMALVRAPDGGGFMGVHFVVNNEPERIWIDDVSVREVGET